MKIKTRILKDFFKKVSTNNTVLEFKADFAAEGVRTVCLNNTNTVKSSVSLSSSSFVEYESIGKVGFQNVDKLITILNGLGEEVELLVEGNLLVLKSGSRTVETELMKEDLIKDETFKELPNPSEESKLPPLQHITLNAEVFNGLIGDVSINKDYNISFSSEDGVLIIKNTGGFRFTERINIEGLKGGLNVSFGYPIVDSFKDLQGVCELKITSQYPVYIKETVDGLVTQRLIAPRVENN